MTKEEAANLTGLFPREFPFARYDYLKCQLGVVGGKMVDMVRRVRVNRDAPEGVKPIYKKEEYPVWAPQFHLKGFGETWEKAVQNFENKGLKHGNTKKRKSPDISEIRDAISREFNEEPQTPTTISEG